MSAKPKAISSKPAMQKGGAQNKWFYFLIWIIGLFAFLCFLFLASYYTEKPWNRIARLYSSIADTPVGTFVDAVYFSIIVAYFGFLPSIFGRNTKNILTFLALGFVVGLLLWVFISYLIVPNIKIEPTQLPTEMEETTTEISRKDSIRQEAADAVACRRYRSAIKLMDEAYDEYGDKEFLELAGKYRMEFGNFVNSFMAAGKYNSAIIQDSTLHVVGDNKYGELNADLTSNVVGVSVGDRFVMALHDNRTVSITGSYTDQMVTHNLGWYDIVAISAGDCHAVGLSSDGKVFAEGFNGFKQANVEDLSQIAGARKIVAISAGYTHTLALLEDGRVIACGDNSEGACNVDTWTNVAAIYTGTKYSVALLTDGTVRITGAYTANAHASEWRDMEMLAAGDYFLVGLSNDGTLLAEALDKNNQHDSDDGQLDVQYLENIIAIAAGHNHVLALDADGIVHALGREAKGACKQNGSKIEIIH